MSQGKDLLGYFERHRDEAVDLLGRLVAIDSPTTSKDGVDRAGELAAREFRAAGARVETIPHTGAGDVLLASFGPPSAERPALLLGHLDTVWPLGEAARRPLRLEGAYALGPGAFDMKAGIVLCVLLARAVKERVVTPCGPVVCLLSADEETGSPASRPAIEEQARSARYVLGLEPCNTDGGAKTSRKGVGRIVLEVEGVPAHTGIDPDRGVNAIEELAAQILAVKLLQDAATGTTVQTGLFSGGVAKNVVAPRARAEIDVRVPTATEWERIESSALALRLRNPKARLRVDARLTHPPMVRTAAIASLHAQARRVAQEIGFDLPEGGTGGGSDGSHCAALGVPVLDGLGVEGEGAHAETERVRIDRLAPRAALLAGILERVAGS